MRRNHWLIVAGSAAFMSALVLQLPAAVALRWLAPAGAQVSSAAGTLWSGSATSVNVGNLRLGPTSWRLSPLALLRGSVGAALDTRIGEASLQGDMVFGRGGSLDCENCSLRGPLASLHPLAPALRNLNGEAAIEFATLSIRNRWPSAAVGTMKLNRVPITAPGVPPGPNAATGNFEATVNIQPVPADGLIEVAVQDGGGPLEISAQLMLRPPGTYELAGRARARPQAPADIVDALAVLGPRTADGSTEISMSGTL